MTLLCCVSPIRYEREREAEDQLDSALSLHARQLGPRQALENRKGVKLYIRKCWIWRRNRRRKHARQKHLNKVESSAGASNNVSSFSNMGSGDITSSQGGGGDEAIIGRFQENENELQQKISSLSDVVMRQHSKIDNHKGE
eukprot:10268669-Ditylum_brightwellii.AAC.1